MTDLTRLRDNSEKKSTCVSAINVNMNTDTLDGAGPHPALVLPKDAVIVAAGVAVTTAMDAGITADLGVAGGSEVLAAADLDDTDPKRADLGTPIATETGMTLDLTFSALPTVGNVSVFVEYLEYDKGTGELTDYATN